MNHNRHRNATRNPLRASWVVLWIAGLWLTAAARADEPPRVRESFDRGWTFHRGEAPGAEALEFDDSGWRTVHLPHDWSIEADPEARGSNREEIFHPDDPSGSGGGYLPGGVGWYRQRFTLPAEASGQRVFVEFEGVYMDSDVWINGQHLGKRPYGYISFEYELTPHLRPGGEENVIAVRVDAKTPSSRWYSGAGIYRHVWLTRTGPVHVPYGGTYITTPSVATDAAEVRVRTQVINQGTDTAEVTVRTTILDPEGQEAGSGESKARVSPTRPTTTEATVGVRPPRLWSPETPSLYTAVTEVVRDGQVVDEVRTPFGFRTIEFTRKEGFRLNGQRVPIQGVCLHHDQGPLGAAAFDRAIERQLEVLKTVGCNAIRTSHNPPAPKLLDLCDRMGFLVMDESFDCWLVPKVEYDYARFFKEWHERDLTDMIRRDRNHPSIILWSIGNEIPDIVTPEGAELAHELAAICRREDRTRPVTSANNKADGTVKSGAVAALDVFGLNYQLQAFDAYRDKYLLLSSESASTVNSRGEYNLDRRDGQIGIVPARENQVSAFGVFVPTWATHAEHMLWKLQQSPWIAGEFVWTGFDYIGEPTPFVWPSVLSYFGFIDLCGFPKDQFYLYQSHWTDQPMVHILPHWNWEGWEGAEVPVWCYSNAEEVELFLNGESLGVKTLKDTPQPRTFPTPPELKIEENKYLQEEGRTPEPQHFAWDVPWRPGVLKAQARRGGQVVAEQEVRTAGAPAKLVLEVDRSTIQPGGQDLAYVTVQVVDEQGTLCPNARDLIHFELSGPADLAAVGNGDPTSHEPFQADHRTAWHGLALAVIRSGDDPGTVHLRATADGLEPAEVTIQVR